MEGFFNETLAAHLQYFTFPLEVAGLALALIEVRFPRTAARITSYIERLALGLLGELYQLLTQLAA